MQAALVEYLKHGGFNQHLQKLRGALEGQQKQMLQAICAYFPKEMRITRPQGGYFIWVEMPKTVNALDVHRLAIERNITIAPGQIFSPQQKFSNCIRLNYGMPWSLRLDAAIATLGDIIASLNGTSNSESSVRAEVAT